jgi:hypothetical protein
VAMSNSEAGTPGRCCENCPPKERKDDIPDGISCRKNRATTGAGGAGGAEGLRRGAGISFSIAPFFPFLPERGQRVDGRGTIRNSGDEGRERKVAGPAVGVCFSLGWSYGARSESKGGKHFL